MAVTIKDIAEGEDYHLKFAATNVYKRTYGNDQEELLFAYKETSTGDGVTTIQKDMNFTGMSTLIRLKNIDSFIKHGILETGSSEVLSMVLPDFNYENHPQYGTEFARLQHEGFIHLSIGRIKTGFKADLLIAHENHSFRIEMSEPFSFCFANSK